MQYKFNFDDKDKFDFLYDELNVAHHKMDKMRKSLFKRYSLLENELKDIKERLNMQNEVKIIDLPIFEHIEKKRKHI